MMSLSLHYCAHHCSLTWVNAHLCSLKQSVLRKHRMLIGVTHVKKAPGRRQFDIYTGFLIRRFLRVFRVCTLKSLKEDIICNIANLIDHRILSDVALPQLVFCSTLFGKHCLIASSLPDFSFRLNREVRRAEK